MARLHHYPSPCVNSTGSLFIPKLEFIMSLDLSSVLFGLISLGYLILIVLVFRTRNEKVQGFAYFLSFEFLLLAISIFRLVMRFNTPLSLIRPETQARFALYSAFLISVFLLQATIAFIKGKPTYWVWWIVAAVAGAGAVLINENPNGMFLDRIPLGASVILRPAAGWVWLNVCWVGFSLGALLTTGIIRQRILHPLHRNRAIFWLAGLVIGMVGCFLSVGSYFILPIGEIVILLAVVTLEYTLFTHDLPDIKRILRESLSTLVFILLSMVAYAVFFFSIQSIFQAQYNLEGFARVAVVAAVLVLLINPALRWFQAFIARVFLESSYDANQLISNYSKNISNILDLSHLAEVITTTIAEEMDLHQARLFLVSQEGACFNLTEVKSSDTEKAPITICISQDSPVAEYLRYERRPLAQYDMDLLSRFRNTPAAEAAAMKELAIDQYVPVSIHQRWIGLLGLGTKKSRSRYFEQDLAVLETIAEQTAVSLENARLYEDLVQRSTENERLNQELTIANQNLSRLDKAKSDFINIASHELRTPLTQIIGYNDILGDMASSGTIPPSTGRQMVDGVGKAARRLEEIVDTMFDVSKLDFGALELDISPVSIFSAIQNAAEKWKDALDSRKVTLILSPSLNKLPTTRGDAKRLVQVFTQLIQNAIQATPDGGQIRISGQCIKENKKKDQSIEIVVADTGIGIAPDEIERIFDKFYRSGNVLLHSSGDIKFKGAGPGLGLTICRGIVEAHGGRMWAESPYHDEKALPGSKFHVCLPIVSEAV
jgi:signal transduction histidine kinase